MKSKKSNKWKKNKVKLNRKIIFTELIFLAITILFSLFGFILISYNGNIGSIITGFSELSIYPKESQINETYSIPIIENNTLPTNTSINNTFILPIEENPTNISGVKEQFGIQPIENLSAQFDEEAGFGIQQLITKDIIIYGLVSLLIIAVILFLIIAKLQNISKRPKKKKKNPHLNIELLIITITILFSLFGLMLIQNQGDVRNTITSFASFSIYPDEGFGTMPIEETTNETYSIPIIENNTLPTNTSINNTFILPIEENPTNISGVKDQFGIQPIENLSAQIGEEAGFGIQPIENLSLAGNETGFRIQPIELNETYVTYNVEVFANGGRYMCESNQPYAHCIKEDGKEAYYGELV